MDEMTGYIYIYPVVIISCINDNCEILIMFLQEPDLRRILKHSHPYRNQRIIDVLQDVYFSGGQGSFTTHFDWFFPCHCDSQGAIKTEVPEPMVALVVIVVRFLISHALTSMLTWDVVTIYVAIYNWQDGFKDPINFTMDVWLDMYNGNLNTLRDLQENHSIKFHVIMSDIYIKVRCIVLGLLSD